jgi:uncharacterized protein YjbI with pentapeptide repeats
VIKIVGKGGNEIYVAKCAGDLRQAIEEAVASGVSLSGASLGCVNLGAEFMTPEQKWGKLAPKGTPPLLIKVKNGSLLVNAKLSGADLTNANLESVDLTNADLSEANLVRAHLDGATLVKTDLAGGNLTSARALQADLSGAHLSGVNFTGGKFGYANLTGANLIDANLTGANFCFANLTGANFVGADLSGTGFIHATLQGANLSKTNLAYLCFRGANLSGADMSGANLAYVDFTGANLTGADISNTRLETAIFTDANLTDVNLAGATLPRDGIKTRGALRMPPFLSDGVKQGGHFKPPQVRSTRVPFSDLPEPMYSTTFLIEKVEDDYYLRNTQDPYYCACLRISTHQISLPRFSKEAESYEYDKETGEPIVDEFKLTLMLAYFDGNARTVGYYIFDKWDIFLPFFRTDKKHQELDKELAWLYYGAKIGTLHGMRHMENLWSERRDAEHSGSYPQPKGEWEAEMFRDIFSSNPKLMTDNEYEMIFGVER